MDRRRVIYGKVVSLRNECFYQIKHHPRIILTQDDHIHLLTGISRFCSKDTHSALFRHNLSAIRGSFLGYLPTL